MSPGRNSASVAAGEWEDRQGEERDGEGGVDAENPLNAPRVEAEPPSPTEVAVDLVKELRKETPGLPRGSIVNFDLAVAFVERYQRMVREVGFEAAQPRVVYHGTSKSNFEAIIAGNLQVPDGDRVVNSSGRSTYGLGIYVSTSFDYAVAYGKKYWADKEGRTAAFPVFVCLCLPGRQHVSVPPSDCGCRRVREGFDSHVSADKGRQISVFFDSSQILPCFLSHEDTLVCANDAAARAVTALHRVTVAAPAFPRTPSGHRPGSVDGDCASNGSASAVNGPADRGTRAKTEGSTEADHRGSGVPCVRERDTAASLMTAEWDGVSKRIKYSR